MTLEDVEDSVQKMLQSLADANYKPEALSDKVREAGTLLSQCFTASTWLGSFYVIERIRDACVVILVRSMVLLLTLHFLSRRIK